MDAETVFEEYVCIVPASIVLCNIFTEFFNKINVTNRVTVVYDDIVCKFYHIVFLTVSLFWISAASDATWQIPFLKLSFPVNFIPMVNPTDSSSVQRQLNNLAPSTSTIVFLAKTHNIEYYILNSQEYVARKQFTWVTVALDTLPFKCDDCTATEMFVIRAFPTGKAEDLRLLNDFIATQELNIDMNYSIKSYQEMLVSTCFDSIQMAFSYLIGNNNTLFSMITDDQKLTFADMGVNKTLFDVLNLINIKYEYGQYIHHFKSYFYQVRLRRQDV